MHSHLLRAAFTLSALLAGTPCTLTSQSERVGPWHVVVQRDAFDDTDRSTVVSPGPNGEIGLGWGCSPSRGLSLVIVHRYLIGSSDGNKVLVQLRFDDRAPVPAGRWRLSADHLSVAVPDDRVVELTREALGAGRVVVRVTDIDGDTVEHAFPLTRLRDALSRLPCATQVLSP